MNNTPIIIEQLINAPREKVWGAISDRNEMKKWYFDPAKFEPVVGFEFQFNGGTEEKQYLHLCTITEAVKGKKLSHSWRYDGYEGDSQVTFELFEEGNKTNVKLTHSGLETFPASNPDFARKNFEEGWRAIIGTTLKDYLEK